MRLVRRVESGAELAILTAESAVCGGVAYRCGRLGSPPAGGEEDFITRSAYAGFRASSGVVYGAFGSGKLPLWGWRCKSRRGRHGECVSRWPRGRTNPRVSRSCAVVFPRMAGISPVRGV